MQGHGYNTRITMQGRFRRNGARPRGQLDAGPCLWGESLHARPHFGGKDERPYWSILSLNEPVERLRSKLWSLAYGANVHPLLSKTTLS
eukprot:scaffold248530_cov17-Tisochrysis_lutea.AAC.1